VAKVTSFHFLFIYISYNITLLYLLTTRNVIPFLAFHFTPSFFVSPYRFPICHSIFLENDAFMLDVSLFNYHSSEFFLPYCVSFLPVETKGRKLLSIVLCCSILLYPILVLVHLFIHTMLTFYLSQSDKWLCAIEIRYYFRERKGARSYYFFALPQLT